LPASEGAQRTQKWARQSGYNQKVVPRKDSQFLTPFTTLAFLPKVLYFETPPNQQEFRGPFAPFNNLACSFSTPSFEQLRRERALFRLVVFNTVL